MKKLALKIVAWSVFAVTIVLTVAPIEMRPIDLLPVNFDRAAAFAVLASLLAIAYPRHLPWIILITTMGAGGIELLQLLSPSRHAHFADAAVKAIGGMCGVIIGAAFNAAIRTLRGRIDNAAGVRKLDAFALALSIRELPVKSRMIQSIYFSPEDGQLRLSLSNGSQRLFEGVSEAEALQMATAQSPGNYYIRSFKHNHKRAA